MSNSPERKSHKDQNNKSEVSMPSVDATPIAPKSHDNEQHLVETQTQQLAELTLGQTQTQPQQTHLHYMENPNPEQGEHDEFEEVLDIPVPPEDWSFNIFLLKLGNKISNDELEALKHLWRGEIGERVLQDICGPLELFKILKQRTFINTNNWLYLQAGLYHLQRKDLLEMSIDFARTIGEVLIFTPASEPVNGYKHVQFHVEGKDFTNCTNRYINELRSTVSRMLLIPPQHITLSGVEPSSSMLITLMIPDMYADVFENMLKSNKSLEELTNIGIDTVAIGGNVFNIHGVDGAEIVETEKQAGLVNVYKQLQVKTRQLEACEIECIKLSREFDTLKDKPEKEHSVDVLKTLFINVDTAERSKKIPASLASQSALAEFEKALKEVEQLGYDKKVIRDLLRINTMVVRLRTTDSYKTHCQKLELAIKDMESQVFPLKFELAKCKFFASVDQTELEQFIQDTLETFLQALLQFSTESAVVALLEEAPTILKKISNQLRYREKQKLKRKYEWDPNDKLTQAINEKCDLFLSCILIKEAQKQARQGQQVDFEQFVLSSLLEVGRHDLKKKFQDMLAKKSKGHRKNAATGQSTQGTNQDVDLKVIAEHVQSIDLKLTAIQNEIESSQQKGYCFDPYWPKMYPDVSTAKTIG